MIQIDLDGKIYRVNYVSASALKAIDSLMPVLKSGPERGTRRSFSQDLDKMVQWFCLLFNNTRVILPIICCAISFSP